MYGINLGGKTRSRVLLMSVRTPFRYYTPHLQTHYSTVMTEASRLSAASAILTDVLQSYSKRAIDAGRGVPRVVAELLDEACYPFSWIMMIEHASSINYGRRGEDEWGEIIWCVTKVRDRHRAGGCALVRDAEHLVGWGREQFVNVSNTRKG
jgi:hypothetical protein